MGKKLIRTLYVDVEQVAKIKKLSDKTRVPQAVYIREGIEMMLGKYEGIINKGVGK